MTITDFFHDAPVLASILTLGYFSLLVVFLYYLVRIYRQ